MMDVQFALMWGVLGFLLNYIPNIGSVISAIPPMIQAFLFNGTYEMILVGALLLGVHMVPGNIVEPRMMGRGLGMSTFVVFLSYCSGAGCRPGGHAAFRTAHQRM